MGGFHLALAVVLVFSETYGLNLLDDCSGDTTGCPDDAQCVLFGCRDQVCVCNAGFINNNDGTACNQLIELDQACTQGNTTCRWGYCSPLGICECASGEIRTTENRCKKAPFADLAVALLGEECSEVDSVFCLDGLTQECLGGLCSCKTDFKPTTDELKAAMPKAGECVRAGLEIGTSITLDCAEVPTDVPVGGECLIDAQCPTGVTCKSVGCKKQCACGPDTAPSVDKLRCLTIKEVGDTCDEGSVCGTLNSLCFDGSCICDGTTEQTGQKLCRRKSPAPGIFIYATVDEACEPGTKLCEDGLVCNAGICDCAASFRRFTSNEERLSFGYPGYCIHELVKAELTAAEVDSLCGDQPAPASPPPAATATAAVMETSAAPPQPSADASPVASPAAAQPSTEQPAASEVAPTQASIEAVSSPPPAQDPVSSDESQVAATSTAEGPVDATPAEASATVVAASDAVAVSSQGGVVASPVAASATVDGASLMTVEPSGSIAASNPAAAQTEPLPSASSPQPAASEITGSSAGDIQPSSAMEQMSSTLAVTQGSASMVGDNCTDSSECPVNSECAIVNCARRQCVCKSGYKPDDLQTGCFTTAQLNEPCNSTVTCWAAGSYCNVGVCGCGFPYEPDQSGRFCKDPESRLIDEACTENRDCLGVLSVCSNNICQCGPGNRVAVEIEIDTQQNLWFGIGQCRLDGTVIPQEGQTISTSTDQCTFMEIGAACTDDIQCPDNSRCVAATGSCNKRCWCNDGYAPDKPSPTKCVPVLKLGDPCTIGENKCRGLQAYCFEGRCSCVRPSVTTPDGFCRPFYPGIGMALLGENCGDLTFCYNKQEQDCVAGVCMCAAGLRPAVDLDYQVQYANSYQCRPADTDPGYRPPLSCTEAPIALVQERPDFSEEITSAKNAGAGGIIAYVMVPAGLVVLGLLTALAVIRYRRRERLRAANEMMASSSDSSETDWSIPRPTLGPYRGDKNWSRSQSEYINPTFVQNMS